MAIGQSAKNQIFDEINITPLTDIFLVLLIIMMVVAPMMEQSRPDIKPPELTNGSDVDPGKLTVEVTAEGQFYIKSEEVAEADLTDVFKSRREELEEKNVVIRADKKTKSGVIMKVLAAAQEAEYEKVTVAGAPLSDDRQNALQSGSNDDFGGFSTDSAESSSSDYSGGSSSLGFEEMY